jgi:hypothetical protein
MCSFSITEVDVCGGLIVIYALSGSETTNIIIQYFYLDLILRNMILTFFPVAQQPNRAQASSFWRFLDHAQLDTPHSVGLLWTNDHSVAETSTWQHTNIHAPVGFEPMIPAMARPKAHATARPLGSAWFLLEDEILLCSN